MDFTEEGKKLRNKLLGIILIVGLAIVLITALFSLSFNGTLKSEAFYMLVGTEILCLFLFVGATYVTFQLNFSRPLQEISDIADELIDGNYDMPIEFGNEPIFGPLKSYLKQIQDTLKIQRDQIGNYLEVIGEVNSDLVEKVTSLSLVAEANSILGATLDLQQKIEDFLSLLKQKTIFNQLVIYLISNDRQKFVCFNPDFSSALPKELAASETTSQVFYTKEMIMVENTGLRRNFDKVTLPFVIGIGSEYNQLALLFLHCPEGQFNESDTYLLKILCGNAASSISNSFLYENSENTKNQLDQKVFNLMSIQQSGKILSSTLDINKLVQLSLDIFLETIWANKGVLLLSEENSGELEVKSFKGLTDKEVEDFENDPRDLKIMALVKECLEPVVVGHFEAGTIGYTSFKTFEAGPYSLYIPLLKEDSLYGVYKVGSKINDQPFTENDLEFLVTLSSQVVISFENARLYSLAITDGMTKLYLHRYFQLRLDEEISRALRYRTPLTLLMLDIDKFKGINDNFGHQQGDIILMQVAKIVKNGIRGTDIAARYGGEEFSVILPETGHQEAMIVAERIRKGVEDFIFPDLEGIPSHRVTVSIGIASVPYNALTKEHLIQRADQALYEAKDTGRNQVVLSQFKDEEGSRLHWKESSRKSSIPGGDLNDPTSEEGVFGLETAPSPKEGEGKTTSEMEMTHNEQGEV